MSPDYDAATILENLADAITSVQGEQDESDRAAMELIEMVGVEVQDVINGLDDDALAEAAAELNATSTWLAAYLAEQPNLARKLIDLLDTAAGTISNLDTSAYDEDADDDDQF